MRHHCCINNIIIQRILYSFISILERLILDESVQHHNIQLLATMKWMPQFVYRHDIQSKNIRNPRSYSCTNTMETINKCTYYYYLYQFAMIEYEYSMIQFQCINIWIAKYIECHHHIWHDLDSNIPIYIDAWYN